MYEASRDTLGFGHHIWPEAARSHFLQQDADLQFGKPRTNATVDTITKRQMAPRILTVDDQLVGIFEYGYAGYSGYSDSVWRCCEYALIFNFSVSWLVGFLIYDADYGINVE